MNTIECKAQWLSRPLTSKTSMSGFEGPAAKTDVDDGFGNPTIKGRITDSYNTFFEETGRVNNSPIYDGTIHIYDTPANRYKIAQHVRSHDLRVKDRNLERAILAANPKVEKIKQPRSGNRMIEMPDDFDGSKVVLSNAIQDLDPIDDPHAQVSDAEFTEVKPETKVPADDESTKLVPKTISVSEVQAGQTTPAAKEAPKGMDPRSVKAFARANAKPAETAKEPEAKAAEEVKTETTSEASPAAQE